MDRSLRWQSIVEHFRRYTSSTNCRQYNYDHGKASLSGLSAQIPKQEAQLPQRERA